jgi:hypothetical protein
MSQLGHSRRFGDASTISVVPHTADRVGHPGFTWYELIASDRRCISVDGGLPSSDECSTRQERSGQNIRKEQTEIHCWALKVDLPSLPPKVACDHRYANGAEARHSQHPTAERPSGDRERIEQANRDLAASAKASRKYRSLSTKLKRRQLARLQLSRPSR